MRHAGAAVAGVVLLAHYADKDGTVVASDRLSLYIFGIRAMLRHQLPGMVATDDVFALLQCVAVHCQRVFTYNDVVELVRIVGGDERVWRDLWWLLSDQNVPMIRVLQASGSRDTPGDDDLLEFRHLSLQEALVAHALTRAAADDTFYTKLCEEALTAQRHSDTARIGGARLGCSDVLRVVLGRLQELPGDRDEAGKLVVNPDEWVGRGWDRSKRQCWWRAVVACNALPQLAQLTWLNLNGCRAGGAWYPLVGVSYNVWRVSLINSSLGTLLLHRCVVVGLSMRACVVVGLSLLTGW